MLTMASLGLQGKHTYLTHSLTVCSGRMRLGRMVGSRLAEPKGNFSLLILE